MPGSPAPPGITFFVAVSPFAKERDQSSRDRITRTLVRVTPPDANNYWMTETNKMEQDR